MMILATLAAGAVALSSMSAPPPGYTIHDVGLGSFTGTPTSPSINDHGQVVLGSFSPAAVWKDGQRTPLSADPGTRAFFINNLGEVVGGMGGADPVGWFTSGVATFGHQIPGSSPRASDLNDHGDVTVTSADGGFIRSRDGAVLPTGLRTISGINNAGAAVGNAGPGSLRAAVFADGVTTVLTGAPPSSNAADINEDGVIVGHYDASVIRPFLWSSGGGMQLLPTLSNDHTLSIALNDAGDAVGYSLGANQRALIWSGGSVFDLSTLVTNGDGWTLLAATDINERGQIVGAALRDGHAHIVLLDPVPAPSSLLLVSLPGLCAAGRRRR